MIRRRIDNKGQSVLSENVMIFFVVVAALVAMTTFVQRTLQARIHDARNYMINAVNSVCDANCQMAAGNVTHEYEPYYMQSDSDVSQNSKDIEGSTRGNAQVLGVVYYNTINEETDVVINSSQLPPACAGPNPPSFCTGS